MTTILNLGCGVKTSSKTVNIDWTIYLRIARQPILRWLAGQLLSQARLTNLHKVGENIIVYDLRKGIPYPDNSVDAVYHSHLLEHIDRDLSNPKSDPAILFTEECRRVLKPGGVLRIVVPDMEKRCCDYVADLALCETDPTHRTLHDEHINLVMGQSAMRYLPGTAHERRALRWLEMTLLGDARKRGLTHQWEYDRFNLTVLLERSGFQDIKQVSHNTSDIADWNETGLDRGENGEEYKPFSLYMEATK